MPEKKRPSREARRAADAHGAIAGRREDERVIAARLGRQRDVVDDGRLVVAAVLNETLAARRAK